MAKAKAKRRYFGRKRRGSARAPRSIPILPILGVAIPTLNAATIAQNTGGIGGAWGAQGTIGAKLYGFVVGMGLQTVGFNSQTGQFSGKYLSWFWGPVILGGLGHKAANWLGINRVFTRHKLPFTL